MSNLSNFQQRVITGLLGMFVFVFGLCYNEYTYFLFFFSLVNICLWEFYSLVKKSASPNLILGFLTANAISILSFSIAKNYLPYHYLALVIPLFAFVFYAELFRKKNQPFTNIGFTILGVVYIAVPFGLLHFTTIINTVYHWEIILGIMLILWTSDSFAYFTGRLIGRHKLFERISPKKTWEGSIGSLVFSVGMAIVLSKLFPIFSLHQWVVIAIITVVCGGMGDLVESLLKRSFDIKDSSTILPGHGGFLDRFDGFILSLPIISTYLILSQ